MNTKLTVKISVLLVSLFYFTLLSGYVKSQTQNLGEYIVQLLPGWEYYSDKSSGENFVFGNSGQGIEVSFKKVPEACADFHVFNQLILPLIQNLQKEQWIIEQRKPAAPYQFASQATSHYMKLKSRATGVQKFVLNPLVNGKMYQIEIKCETVLDEPPEEVTTFISQTSVIDSPASIVKNTTTKPATDNFNQNIATNESIPTGNKTSVNEDLSSFKKVKDPEPAQQNPKPTPGNASTGVSSNSNTQPEATALPASSQKTDATPSQSAPSSFTVEKGNVPDVKFTVTDPCANKGNTNGLPWEPKKADNKIDIPKGVEPAEPPVIPDLKSLSSASYNGAVSTAFEAMRLVYGPMPDDEAKKFEAAWTPLFDFPSQEVIDYLNKLNPLVSQFLACRESYIRSLSDMQMVLLDASLAVELKEQHAWEAAMASAGLSVSGLQPLEAAMNKLAQQIEVLGNPPDPNAAKCDARKRYRKTFQQPEFPFEGVWVSSDGSKIITKAAHIYEDGKVLVYNYPETWFKTMEAKGYNTDSLGLQYVEGQGMAGIPGVADLLWVYEEQAPGVWLSLDWSLVITVSAIKIDGKEMVTNIYTPPNGFSEESKFARSSAKKTDEPYDNPPVKAFGGSKKTWDDLVGKIEKEKWYSGKLDQYMKWRKDGAKDIEMAINGQVSDKQKRKEEYAKKKEEIDQQFESDKRNDQLALSSVIAREASAGLGPDYRLPRPEPTADRNRAERFQKLDEEYSDVVKPGNYEVKQTQPQVTGNPDDEAKKLEAQRLEQEKRDAINFHSEMVQLISKNLEKEIADRNMAFDELLKSKTPQEAENNKKRIKEFDLRIINLQSNIQSEQDLVASYQTGQMVHTRTVFDEYARNKMIADMKDNAARVDATRRIAQRIDRVIELLPEELRANARESVRKNIDGKTIASGDIAKAKRLSNAIYSQVKGYAEYDGAMAKIAEVDAQQNEFYAQTTIMAAGAVFMGLGSAALAEAYGAEAALTIYGTQALGAVWGGTTGLIAGGPKEGIQQAISWWSPYGYSAVQFYEGYKNAGYEPNPTLANQIWNGVYEGGSALFLGKVFELGTKIITKGSMLALGNESCLFKPIVKTSSQRSREVLDAMRTTQKLADAQDELKAFQNLEKELVALRQNPAVNSRKIQQLDAQIRQLSASMNASYYCKWLLKYKATPEIRWKFDQRIQGTYSEMTPGMIKRLEQMGYNMEGIEFRQFRNGTSSGSSSMDLDLGPVQKGTTQEPGMKMFSGKKMVIKKDGSIVTMEQFMNDAQQSMNAEYKQITGYTARSSDMNLVTSVHPEAFSTPKLLDHKIDFSSFTADEIASIGKVLSVKMNNISNNPLLTNTSKIQAQCRESSKEIENMLIRKLRSNLEKAPAGSPQQKQIQSDINYWEEMLKRFKQIGTQETDPMKIVELNREIMKDTGGKDVTGVINDLIIAFKSK
jgi:hypothetical protein